MKLRNILLFLYKYFASHLSQNKIGNYQIIASIHSHLLALLKPNIIEVLSNKMVLDSGDSLRLSIKTIHDPLQTELIKKFVKNGDTVIDVGAHIGYYTLLLAGLVGKKGQVYAFEPSPENFKILKKNVKINGYTNVTLVNKALSNQPGLLNLYLSQFSQADHQTYYTKAQKPFIKVRAATLDKYFKNLKKEISFIKIDVQGFESKIIKGMDNLLSKNKRLKILIEFWPLGISNSKENPKELLEILVDNRYKIYDISEYTNTVKRSNVTALLEKYNVKNTKVTNLLCLR